MINNNTIGNYGEFLSEIYLCGKNYNIICKNYRTKFGEIDLIARKHNIIIFFEVKSRYTRTFGNPLQSISIKKKASIIRNSKLFLLEQKFFNTNIRFDVIEVFLNYKNNNYKINHIKNAFK